LRLLSRIAKPWTGPAITDDGRPSVHNGNRDGYELFRIRGSPKCPNRESHCWLQMYFQCQGFVPNPRGFLRSRSRARLHVDQP